MAYPQMWINLCVIDRRLIAASSFRTVVGGPELWEGVSNERLVAEGR
jgi:hypothetical protein